MLLQFKNRKYPNQRLDVRKFPIIILSCPEVIRPYPKAREEIGNGGNHERFSRIRLPCMADPAQARADRRPAAAGGVMTPQEIAARLIEIHTVMVDHFDAQPWIGPTADVSQDGKVLIKIYAPRGTDGPIGKRLRSVSGDTFEEALDAALAFVTALPPANETKRIDWQKRLGNLIDDGREIGIETEFLNPLEASMKRLASNALTHEVSQ